MTRFLFLRLLSFTVIFLLMANLAWTEKIIPDSPRLSTIADGQKLTLTVQGYTGDYFLDIEELPKETLRIAELINPPYVCA